MFDEYFNPPSSAISPVLVAAAPRVVDIASSPSSTTVDQDDLHQTVYQPDDIFTKPLSRDIFNFLIEKLGMRSMSPEMQNVYRGRLMVETRVGTPSTGSGKLYFQWELSSSSGNALCILFPTINRNMNPVTAQQVALNNALVALEKRLKIEKCNARIKFSKPQRETTYQVTLDALKLSPCYLAFLITAKVPEIYMHPFWNTIKKIKNTNAYWFKLDKQKF
nr:hypothetical protein [Tanacetum cinerariifolium]